MMLVLELRFVLGGVALPLKEPVHNLGVLLDSQLASKGGPDDICGQRAFCPASAGVLAETVSKVTLATVVHALVTARQEHCHALYMGHS